MSAHFVLPFNNQPISTTARTSSYTVPVGKYARFIACHYDCTIGGTYLYPSQTNSYLIPQTVGNTKLFSVGGFGSFSVGGISSSAVFYSGDPGNGGTIIDTGGGLFTYTFNLGSGFVDIWGRRSSAAGSGDNAVVTFRIFSKPIEIWVPSGTVLNGSSYIVEEFNVLA